MIDIDKLEALAKAATSGLPGDRITFALHAIDPEGMLALIAELRALREDAAKVRKAAIFHDQLMESVHGCTDGGCLIRRPQGMHTNGGCRCARDSMKTQRVLYAARELRAAIGGAK